MITLLPIAVRKGSPRFVLLLVWLLAFAILFSAVSWLQWSDRIGEESYRSLSELLKNLFKPYLLMMVGFFGGRITQQLGTAARLATVIVASLLWIGWISIHVGSLVAGRCCVETTATQLRQVTDHLAWIVGPALGFYFGARHD